MTANKEKSIKTVSLVMPAYNEEDNIAAFFAECLAKLDRAFDYEYIFVNDGSQDKTGEQIKRLIQDYPDQAITGINFSRNFGKEAAILAGLKEAQGDYISLIDVDLQQDPIYINQMLRELEDDPDLDMVACYQDQRKEKKLVAGLKSLFYDLIDKMSDRPFAKNASDFRTFRRELAEAVIAMPEYHRFSKGLFSWVGFKTAYLPYQVKDRLHGKTSWSFKGLVKYALEGFFGFSVVPLKLATYLGFFTSLAAILYFIYIVLHKLIVGISVKGYATIVCLILLLSGVQLICMGIIGEYLARTYLESKQRPHYIIKNRIKGNGPS